MKNSPSPSFIDQAMTGLAVILVAGTLILPFAKGAVIGTGPSSPVEPNALGCRFTVLGPTNLSLPPATWPMSGQATYDLPMPGPYLFIDPGAGTNQPQRFYDVRWP